MQNNIGGIMLLAVVVSWLLSRRQGFFRPKSPGIGARVRDRSAPVSAAPQPEKARNRSITSETLRDAAKAELDRLDGSRDARSSMDQSPAGMDEARYNPIMLAQHPVPREKGWLSFYGGMPIVPPGFAWPMAEADPARAMAFLLQIDCTQLTAVDATGLLPTDGVLYGFLDYVDGSAFGFRMVHASGPAAGWTEAEPPASLPPLNGARYLPHSSSGIEAAAAHLPTQYLRWTFEPVRIAYASIGLDDPDSNDWFWGAADDAELMRAQAQVGTAEWRDSMDTSAPHEWKRPFAAFPQDWAAVRILASTVAKQLRPITASRPSFLAELGEETKSRRITQWRDEAAELFAFAARHPMDQAVPQDMADEIWAWCETVQPAIRLWLRDAVTNSVNTSFGIGSAATAAIPVEWVASIAPRHALAYEYEHDERPDRSNPEAMEDFHEREKLGQLRRQTSIHAGNPSRMFGPPSYVQGDVEEYVTDHLTLLEMTTSSEIDFELGDGVIQCLIRPDDLKARRFDKVVVVASSY